jgi:hypothetical protein
VKLHRPPLFSPSCAALASFLMKMAKVGRPPLFSAPCAGLGSLLARMLKLVLRHSPPLLVVDASLVMKPYEMLSFAARRLDFVLIFVGHHMIAASCAGRRAMNGKCFPPLTSPCLQLTAVQVLGGFVFVAFGSTLPTAAPFPFDGRRRPVALRRPIALTFRFIHPAERLPSSDFDCSEIIFVNCAAHQQGSQKSGQSGFDHARDWTVSNGLWKSRPVWTRHFRAGPRCLSGPG